MSVWADEQVLVIDSGDGWLHNTMNVLYATELYT